MKHLGDICKLKGAEIPLPDVVIGGSPCQNLSQCGNRMGLEGQESRLFYEQVRLFKEIRDARTLSTDEHIRHNAGRFLVWENVVGALHCTGGEDFRAVLELLCRVCEQDATVPRPSNGKWGGNGIIVGDGYSLAWKVTDCKDWGAPQRRRRICIILDADGHAAPEILFGEPKPDRSALGGHSFAFDRNTGCFRRREVQPIGESGEGDNQQSGEAREGTAGNTADGAGERGKCGSAYGFDQGAARDVGRLTTEQFVTMRRRRYRPQKMGGRSIRNTKQQRLQRSASSDLRS